MASDPDGDLQAQRMALDLRQSNVMTADAALERAERLLLDAENALGPVPSPQDHVSAILFAQAHGAVAAAICAQVEARMNLEAERAEVSHVRAHLDFADGQARLHEKVGQLRAAAMHQLENDLRDAGFNPQQLPGGLVIPPPEDDNPNS